MEEHEEIVADLLKNNIINDIDTLTFVSKLTTSQINGIAKNGGQRQMVFKEKRLMIDNNQLYYYTTDEKSDVTYYFLSGWGVPSTIVDMYGLTTRLNNGNSNIVVIERFGQGKSDKIKSERTFENVLQEIHQIIEKDQSPKKVLIGHSLGGFYAFEYAKTKGGIDEIILLDVVPMTSNITRFLYNINYLYVYFFDILKKFELLKNASIYDLAKLEKIKDIEKVPKKYQDIAECFCKNDIYNVTVKNEFKYFKKSIKKLYLNTQNLNNLRITNIVRKQTYKMSLKMKKVLKRQGVKMCLINVGKSSHYIHNENPDKVANFILKLDKNS